MRINGRKTPVHAGPRTFLVIDRQWKDGDTIELTLPMEVRLRYWIRNGNSVSVERGPLTHAFKIGEVQPSPVQSEEPVETVILIPMGAARLRISAFPWIGEGPNAHAWQLPQ